jgi:hypothetical protein
MNIVVAILCDPSQAPQTQEHGKKPMKIFWLEVHSSLTIEQKLAARKPEDCEEERSEIPPRSRGGEKQPALGRRR